MKIGIAADHGGYELKERVKLWLHAAGYQVHDYGAHHLDDKDDYPDFVIPLAYAISKKEVDKGVAICGSGIGACIASNKVKDVRAALVHDTFSARQGVEDDDMNLICLGGRVAGPSLAWEVIKSFLEASFSNAERHRRRLAKVIALEKKNAIDRLD
jgi:ribose 5-phosphate isomerase B